MNRYIKKNEFICLGIGILLFFLAGFNLFYKLGNPSISSWDEARHGISAYEMLKNGNFIVNTYKYKNDYWNLKPPLSFWTIIAGYKIAGFNALGLRLLSSICSMLTIIAVAFFVLKRHGKVASFFSILCLSTCTQFLINHSARTGDADSIFVLFFTASILSLLASNVSTKGVTIAGFFFSLAFLTKSWHSANIVLIIVFVLFITGRYKALSFKQWTLICFCIISPVFLWAFFRYQFDGLLFFKKMIMYDLFQRSTSSIEGHNGGDFFYLGVLFRFFSLWIVFLFGLMILMVKKRMLPTKFNREHKIDFIGILLWILIPLLTLSLSKTKIRWYILPIYPPLSIAIGVLASKVLLRATKMIRIILIMSLFFIAAFYEWAIGSFINNPIRIPQVDLIQTLVQKKEIQGKAIFISDPTNQFGWQQNSTLAAELYGRLHVENGGYPSFLKNRNSLLLIEKKQFLSLKKSKSIKIIASNEWGFIITYAKND